MLVEKHKPVNLLALVALVPLKWDKILDCLDRLLDEDPLFQAVKADLARRYRHTLTRGRHSTPVEVILRMLVVKHLYRWSYEQTETFVADSIILRQFCRVYWQKVPDDTVLNRWANLLQPETLHQLLAHVSTMAHRLQVTRGRKLRTDGTVVESDIHLPTDSSLLADGVRVLGRTLGRARRVLQSAATDSVQVAQTLFRNRWRSARNTAREISRAVQQTTQEGKKRSVRLYRKLLGVTRASVQQAQQVAAVLRQETTRQADQLAKQIEHFVPLVEQVVRQATRRVLQGESVPAQDKLVSLFEPHTDIIRRGKPGRTAEFGHKVWIDEVDGGIVSDYRVLDGNAPDQSQWLPSLERHQELFGRPPDQMSGDRGMYSRDNEARAQVAGVRRVILPQAGHRSAARKQYEQQRWFRRGRRYHQGIEGRISALKRRYGLDRCRDHGESGFERWVGWGIIAHNLLVIGSAVATR
jgi:IS5 family transposase